MKAYDEHDLMAAIRELGLFPQTPVFWSVIDHIPFEALTESETLALLDQWLDFFYNRQSQTPALRRELQRAIQELLMQNDFRLPKAAFRHLFRSVESAPVSEHIGAAIGFLKLSYDEAFIPDIESWLESPNPSLSRLAREAIDFIRQRARHPARPLPEVIREDMLLPKILEVYPAFQLGAEQNSEAEATASALLVELARSIDTKIRQEDDAGLPAIFLLIESLLCEGEPRVEDAAEALLEYLMAAQTPAQAWVPLLGEWSRSYCSAMDEFMSKHTEGLT